MEILNKIKEYQKDFEQNFEKEAYTTVSFSQFSMYSKCPFSWYLAYAQGLTTRPPNIYSCFGTSFHETVQDYLKLAFSSSMKNAKDGNWSGLLKERFKHNYTIDTESLGRSFSDKNEIKTFYNQGVKGISELIKNTSKYYNKSYLDLVGIEVPIFVEVRPNVYFLGYIDGLFFNKISKKFLIDDLKTSTRGWGSYAKKDVIKRGQILLYRYFFSKQFGIPLEDIEGRYLIFRRELDFSHDFPVSSIQEYTPPQSTRSISQIVDSFNNFLDYSFDEKGNYNIDKLYLSVEGPRKFNCTFCEFKENHKLCPPSKRKSKL